MTIDPNFREFLLLLDKHHVEYMIIGGYALAFHGKPRNTGDLDVWINISVSNANKLLEAIADFRIASLQLSAKGNRRGTGALHWERGFYN